MKVVYVTSSLEIGGIEVNLVRLTQELDRRGHEVIVAARGGVLTSAVVEAGARHIDLTLSHRRPFAAVRSALAFLRLLRRERPDVVHIFSASGAAVAWPAVRLCRPRPLVMATIMGLKMSDEEPDWVSSLRAWGVSLGADRLMITAPAIGDVVRHLPIARRRVFEGQVVGVPDPDPDDHPTPLHEELGFDPNDRIVVTIGRLAEDKSHHLFLEAADRVRRHRQDVRFLVVGGGGLHAMLQERLDALGLAESAVLLGERTDVDGILRSTDICVKPGVVEGFIGITVLEAQMHGVPVVAFDTKDVRLAIQDGENGVIVPAGDVNALASGILDLLDDPQRSAAIGARGRETVQQRFSMTAIVDDLLAVYDEELARRRDR